MQMSFPRESAFSQAENLPLGRLFSPTERAATLAEPNPDTIQVSRTDMESMYREAHDLVRQIGISHSTTPRKNSQKLAQRASSGQSNAPHQGADLTDMHDRLTDLRDTLYRYLS